MAQGYISKRIVTPQGTRAGALLVDEGKIRAICGVSELPGGAEVQDCGEAALLHLDWWIRMSISP